MSAHAVSRASPASARLIRARTSSDLTAGRLTSSDVAMLRVAEPFELAHQEGRALLVGKAPEVVDQAGAGVSRPPLCDGRVVAVGRRHLELLGRHRGRPAQLVDAAVVRDAVEPGAQRDRAVVGAQAAVRAQEDVLQ